MGYLINQVENWKNDVRKEENKVLQVLHDVL